MAQGRAFLWRRQIQQKRAAVPTSASAKDDGSGTTRKVTSNRGRSPEVANSEERNRQPSVPLGLINQPKFEAEPLTIAWIESETSKIA